MKKILALVLALVLVLGLTACGDKEADADFALLNTYADDIAKHDTMRDERNAVGDQYKAGEATVEDVIASYQAMADHSADMYTRFQAEEWTSDESAAAVEAMMGALENLTQVDSLNVEMVTNNDASLSETIQGFTATYNDFMAAYLEALPK